MKVALISGAVLFLAVLLWIAVPQFDQQNDVEQAEALYHQGSELILSKDYEAAADKLEQALVLNKEDIGTLYALGVVYYKLGNLKLAKGYFAAMLEINPNDETAKGLMDIMAGLERNSVTEPEQEGTGN